MRIIRQWAMPSSETFSIPPIKAVVEWEVMSVPKGGTIVDPFARAAAYGTITNDLDPEQPAEYHLDALEFLRGLQTASADLILYDPPYSPRQASECYRKVGKEKLANNVTNSEYWARCLDEVARITKSGGRVVSCGWNTNGVGKKRGFEIESILIVAHGGRHNDTLVTVETKKSAASLLDLLSEESTNIGEIDGRIGGQAG